MKNLHFLMFALSLLLLSACKNTPLNPLTGHWTNGTSQTLIFDENQHARWMFYESDKSDTIKFDLTYSFDQNTIPMQLDFSGFDAGRLKGLSLYGIVEFDQESSMRCFFVAGKNDSIRPTNFEPERTQVFLKTP